MMKLIAMEWTMEDGRGECHMRVEGAAALLCPVCGAQVLGEHHCQSPKPKRIQRSRAKGWRMPEGAVYVGRPTKFGNPFLVSRVQSAAEAVSSFRAFAKRMPPATRAEIVRELRGKDLMCWCALDQPCHADVLLEIANADERRA